jgi:hypothetical protein
MRNHNLANQSETSLKGEVPWCALISDDIAKVIIENINDLIITDCRDI